MRLSSIHRWVIYGLDKSLSVISTGVDCCYDQFGFNEMSIELIKINKFMWGYFLPLSVIVIVACFIQKSSPSFWNFAYKDKRDGQKCHFSLKTYDGWKTIDFGNHNVLKWKCRGLFANTKTSGAYLQILQTWGGYIQKLIFQSKAHSSRPHLQND